MQFNLLPLIVQKLFSCNMFVNIRVLALHKLPNPHYCLLTSEDKQWLPAHSHSLLVWYPKPAKPLKRGKNALLVETNVTKLLEQRHECI